MKVGIGVSTGIEVVCATLVIQEDDGTRSIEYRTVSADSEVNTDIGDLVVSAVELMASLAPSPEGQGAHTHARREPDAIVVAHRTSAHAASIRSAFSHSHRRVFLVSESDAAHAFLEDSGLVARYGTVAVVDVGASGTTASVIDAHSGAVQAAERTAHFSGDVINRLVKDLVHGTSTAEKSVRDDLRDDRGIGSARYRSVKEHLSAHESAEVGGVGGTASVDRAAFDEAIRPYAVSAAQFTSRVSTSSTGAPEAVVLIGGGAKIPVVGAVFGNTLGIPVIAPGEPDTILAKGAAYLAVTGPDGRYAAAGVGTDSTGRSIGRFGGAVAGALLVGGIVLAYGIQTLTPSGDSSFAPAGTEAPNAESTAGQSSSAPQWQTTADPIASTGGEATREYSTDISSTPPTRSSASGTGETTAPSSTPTLHPAPNLPVIDWPSVPTDGSDRQPTSPPSTISTATTTTTVTAPPVTISPVTTTPGTGGSTELQPPPDAPTLSATPAAPEGPASGSVETSPPRGTASIPTTEVDGTPPTSRVLTPPPTVWTPPPAGESVEVTTAPTADATTAPPG
nr:Hsp70 family protein [Rhodococcus sp. (in: high G+C Gram-positive bacteria)]